MLAQDRDRLPREPAYLSYLREAFGKHGCKLRVLTDRGDDCSEGRLTDGILDQIACFERIKIAEGTRRGKELGGVSLLRKAREEKIVALHTSRYRFKLNAARDAYKVNKAQMEGVRHIFRMLVRGAYFLSYEI